MKSLNLKNLLVILFVFLLYFNIYGRQDFVVKTNGDTIYGKSKFGFCLGRKCDSLNVKVKTNSGMLFFNGYEIDYIKKNKRTLIVRKFDALNPFHKLYRLMADGPVKVFDCDLSHNNEIACVELEDGQFFPVTEKLFNKWILPSELTP